MPRLPMPSASVSMRFLELLLDAALYLPPPLDAVAPGDARLEEEDNGDAARYLK
jgi:hypothetical protein